MRAALIRLAAVVCLFALLGPVHAHIGSTHVFFEGDSGDYRVRVSIKPPEVVPGRAQIYVRVLKGDVQKIGVLPVRWDAGREGAPPPDICEPVPGDTNLFFAQLWLMDMGAYSVFVELDGAAGPTTAIVPLNSISTQRLAMSKTMGGFFLGCGAVLVLLLVQIVSKGVRESVLPVGALPDRKRIFRGRIAAVIATLVIGSGLAYGRHWWNEVDRDFRMNRLFKPLEVETSLVHSNDVPVLSLDLAGIARDLRDHTPLVPDHGKLMHLFLVGKNGVNSFAHLHPERRGEMLFTTPLPDIPAGSYSLFADITHESGLSQTLIAEVELPKPSSGPRARLDEDDSWWNGSANALLNDNAKTIVPLENGARAIWLKPSSLIADAETVLRFELVAADGQPAPMEPYMGMWAHLIICSEDRQVFTHLHPGGTISMAAQELFAKRERERRKDPRAKDVVCGRPEREFIFPYAFPRPGKYRMWLQTRSLGEVVTAAFDVHVASSAPNL